VCLAAALQINATVKAVTTATVLYMLSIFEAGAAKIMDDSRLADKPFSVLAKLLLKAAMR
jgi:hypothetical protein